MTFHQLKIFASVAKHFSITKAAEELYMSQPAVSHQLKLLEDEFGRSFYFSSHTGLQLTQEGQAFLSEVKPIESKMSRGSSSPSKRNGNLIFSSLVEIIPFL